MARAKCFGVLFFIEEIQRGIHALVESYTLLFMIIGARIPDRKGTSDIILKSLGNATYHLK